MRVEQRQGGSGDSKAGGIYTHLYVWHKIGEKQSKGWKCN